jgi:hypothetical protein
MVETPPLRNRGASSGSFGGSLEVSGARSLLVAFPYAGMNRIRFEGVISGLSATPRLQPGGLSTTPAAEVKKIARDAPGKTLTAGQTG